MDRSLVFVFALKGQFTVSEKSTISAFKMPVKPHVGSGRTVSDSDD